MAAYISRKNAWFRCLASFLPAAALGSLLCVMAAGPRLGPLYDFLLRRRPEPPVAGELLLIDTALPGQELGDDILEPGAASSLFFTMTELGAEALIVQVPILGLSAGNAAAEAEILYRFDEEFSLLSRNIRSLFDAIRTGSVAPSEAARYVGELVELSERGKERLVSALVHRDEEGIEGMERAAAFFGHVRRPGDLQVQLIRGAFAGGPGRPGVLAQGDEYSRARPDRDGVLRRAAPVLKVPRLSEGEGETGEKTLEHIIYGALKARYGSSLIEYREAGPFLVNRGGPEGTDMAIPLDRNGAVLFEKPRNGEDFRRIGLAEFLAYDEADRSLARLLEEAESLGIYQGIAGEDHPLFLHDYALSLREELAAAAGNGDESLAAPWIDARSRYFQSLEDFLYGPAEMNLVGGYETIIAAEALEEDSIARMIEMRDTLIQTFVALRSRYNEALEFRNKLEKALAGSFCILGRAFGQPPPHAHTSREGGPGGIASLFADFPRSFVRNLRSALYKANPTDAEVSALLANSLLTGRAIQPGRDCYLLLGALVWTLIVSFVLKRLGPVLTLGTGLFLVLLVGSLFSVSFIFSGLWLDPLVPAAAALGASLISFVWALAAKGQNRRRFRLAFGPAVSRPCLAGLIRAGRPFPSQMAAVHAAVIGVRNSGAPENVGGPNAALAALAFRERGAELFREAGGTVIGIDGEVISVCFGSPLERVFLGSKKRASPYEDSIHALAAPAVRAVEVVSEIAALPECASWQFGLDMGDCSFVWSPLSGYTAFGRPVQRARLFSRLAARCRARIIISAGINEALPDLAVKKLDLLKNEAIYRLL